MKAKTFNIITSISMVLTITAALLSILGIPITGLYPAIIVLILLAIIPVYSRRYIKKTSDDTTNKRKIRYLPFIIINLFVILIVFWMSFVILVDRVLSRIL